MIIFVVLIFIIVILIINNSGAKNKSNKKNNENESYPTKSKLNYKEIDFKEINNKTIPKINKSTKKIIKKNSTKKSFIFWQKFMRSNIYVQVRTIVPHTTHHFPK